MAQPIITLPNKDHRKETGIGIGIGTGNRSMTDNNIVVGYSPSDFFYVDAINRGTFDPNECAALNPYDKMWDIKCTTEILDNSANCIKKELCKNKDAAEALTATQTVTSGKDIKYIDTKTQYYNEMMFSVNLGIGILFVSTLIYQGTASASV